MKLSFLNDTGKKVAIHSASEPYVINGNMRDIQLGETRVFIIPDGESGWIELWGNNKTETECGKMQILVCVDKFDSVK